MSQAECIVHVENDQVRVTEWRFEPGSATGHHRHEHDYVVVPLTPGLLRLLGKTGEATAALLPGESYFRKAGIEHDVINGGSEPLSFVEIELLSRPQTEPAR
jgi:beta-alanine degradation protein BauB